MIIKKSSQNIENGFLDLENSPESVYDLSFLASRDTKEWRTEQQFLETIEDDLIFNGKEKSDNHLNGISEWFKTGR